VSRLLHVDPDTRRLVDRGIDELPSLLAHGDLLVVNDAATLPASLGGRMTDGADIELRLAGEQRNGSWRAVLFGSGDWRTPTEHRPAPPPVRLGDRILIAEDLGATVESVAAISPRLVEVRFDRTGDALWTALYRHGRPVQYAYEPEPVRLESMQTPYAARPWAAEMPSAGRPLRRELLAACRRRGVRIAFVTHAAGLSSTGDPALDAALPLPERYEIPIATVDAVRDTPTTGGRIIAVGTTVVRALEGCAADHDGEIVAGEGVTALVLTPEYEPLIVDGLLSGVHAPDSSHFAMLGAFLSPSLLAAYARRVEDGGYRGHEHGDSTLILPAEPRAEARERASFYPSDCSTRSMNLWQKPRRSEALIVADQWGDATPAR
jgi:S-adenosylmethionine:tRNA ribosyltransferase-isomerase